MVIVKVTVLTTICASSVRFGIKSLEIQTLRCVPVLDAAPLGSVPALQQLAETRREFSWQPLQKKNMLGGPAICECGTSWTNAGLIRDHGYLDKCTSSVITASEAALLPCISRLGTYYPANWCWSRHPCLHILTSNHTVGDNLNALIIMHYPTDNCPDETGTRGTPEELQRKTQSNAASYAQVCTPASSVAVMT